MCNVYYVLDLFLRLRSLSEPASPTSTFIRSSPPQTLGTDGERAKIFIM